MNVDLVPVGDIDQTILKELKGGLETVLGCCVKIVEQIAIPDRAFDPSRNQYLSDAIISSLRQQKQKSAHLLGVTGVDIYTDDLNFVFGQADGADRVALISLNRLRDEDCALPGGEKLLAERSLKEAVHELGHTLGLGHCGDTGCVMHFSNSLIDTDVKGRYFCSRCRPKLIE